MNDKYFANDRLKEIDSLVDELLPNNPIKEIISKYANELEDYDYIESLDQFSTLYLKGSLKYVSKYDGKLRSGGLLIKIYQKDNKWYGIVKKLNGKKYHVSFNFNYIFYRLNKNDERVDLLKVFMTDVDNGLYEIV